MESLESSVYDVIAKVLKCSPSAISSDMFIGDIERWDSLNHQIIIMTLEQQFDLAFDIDQVADVEGVQDLVNLVKAAVDVR